MQKSGNTSGCDGGGGCKLFGIDFQHCRDAFNDFWKFEKGKEERRGRDSIII
jgi:hypothetical protein